MIDARRLRAALALARALSLGVCLPLGACGGAQIGRCDTAHAIALHVHPAKNLNPDRAGLPRSVVVRVYQLGDTRSFSGSSFERLWAGASEGLPAAEQLIALPGRNQDHSLPRDPAARYLAVLANFREREGDSGWRALVRLPEAGDRCAADASGPPLELELADYSLHLR